MTASTVPASDIDKNLDAACAAIGSEIARTDGKSSLFSEPAPGSKGERTKRATRQFTFRVTVAKAGAVVLSEHDAYQWADTLALPSVSDEVRTLIERYPKTAPGGSLSVLLELEHLEEHGGRSLPGLRGRCSFKVLRAVYEFSLRSAGSSPSVVRATETAWSSPSGKLSGSWLISRQMRSASSRNSLIAPLGSQKFAFTRYPRLSASRSAGRSPGVRGGWRSSRTVPFRVSPSPGRSFAEAHRPLLGTR